MSLIVVFLAALLFAAIAWYDLRRGTLLLAALLPSYLWRFELFGIPSTFLEVCVLILVAIWFTYGRKTFPLPPLAKRVAIPVLLLLTVATIAVLIAPDRIAALGIWKAYYAEPIAIVFILLAILKEKTDITAIRSWLLGSGVFVACAGILQWILNVGIPAPWDLERRITSIFPYPNAVGLFLGPLAAMAFVSAFETKGKHRWISLGAGALMALAILLAQSEASLAGLLGTLVILGLLTKATRKRTAIVVLALACLVVTIPPLREYGVEKMTLRDYSGGVRRSQWNETIAYLKDGHTLFGAGLSGYPAAFVPYHIRTEFEVFQYPHELFLNVWVELGILGLVLFLLFLALFARALLRPHPLLTLPFLAALLHMLIHGLVDAPFFKNDLALLTAFLVAMILLSYDRQSSPQRL